MNSKNVNNYENVVIRKEQEIGINNFGLEYLVSLEQEIERQKEIIRQLDIKNLELTTIIKEVREYIENDVEVYYVLDTRLNKAFDKTKKVKKDLLGILDKVDKDNK